MATAPLSSSCLPRLDIAPYRLSGTVVAALLNHRRSLDALGSAAIAAAPYKGAPKAVVLAIKPRAALVFSGDPLLVDDPAGELEVGATLAAVIGRTACAVAEADALAHVAGYLVVADATVPRASHFRPQIRSTARDASCALGASVVARDDVGADDALALRTFVDGALVATASTADRVRSTARLLAAISEFMTLMPGDMLLTGSAAGLPRVRAGAHVAIEIDRIGRLETRVAVCGECAGAQR